MQDAYRSTEGIERIQRCLLNEFQDEKILKLVRKLACAANSCSKVTGRLPSATIECSTSTKGPMSTSASGARPVAADSSSSSSGSKARLSAAVKGPAATMTESGAPSVAHRVSSWCGGGERKDSLST